MHKIIKTTDNKHIGKIIDMNDQIVPLKGVSFIIKKIEYTKDNTIILNNGEDYLIEVVLVNELS